MIYGHPNYTGNDYPDLVSRKELLRAQKKLISMNLNRGDLATCSLRLEDGQKLLITPPGTPVEKMTPASIVEVALDGPADGNEKQSRERRLHYEIMKNRSDAKAIVVTHSDAASALSCLRRDIPSFHYRVAIAGGDSIRCAPYALFGTHESVEAALQALRGRKACLLANYGAIALGRDLDEAVQIAQEVETLAAQYLLTCNCGNPKLLSSSEMNAVLERFNNQDRKLKN